jgi:hypothetical protein
MSNRQLIRRCVSVVVMAALTSGCCDPSSSKHLSSVPLCYRNPQYRFAFYLPASWPGYGVVVQQWERKEYFANLDRLVVIERGPTVVLRHRQWTAGEPYQDIPIFVFTRRQWETHHQEPVGGGVDEEPTQNSNYVFAISSRYNADDLVKGWKETNYAVERNRCERPHLYAE